MSLKQQLSKYERLSNMSSASVFTLTGNEEVLELDADSAVGIKIKQYVEGKRDSVLEELKEDVSNL